jgi:hypothetical protein
MPLNFIKQTEIVGVDTMEWASQVVLVILAIPFMWLLVTFTIWTELDELRQERFIDRPGRWLE